ncbi:porin [Pseudaeromonas paramecii]|uniref:Porin n=1 Tax=Pseudaeromonas paramecii TaxID=2138166 RepID=A0ABP8Q9L0_9GAMM
MKHSVLALMIPSVLGASAAQAVSLYDQDGTQLNLNGRVVGLYYGSGDEDSRGDESYLRVGLDGRTQINNALYGFGAFEYNLPTSGSDNDEVRQAFAGLGGDFGAVSYGRQFGLFSKLNDYTDVLPEFGGDGLGSGADLLGTGRNSGLLQYNVNYNGLFAGLQYTGQADAQHQDADSWSKNNGEGYAALLGYDFPEGVSLAAAYNRVNKTSDQRANASFGGTQDAELTGVGMKYDANRIYAAATYSYGRHHIYNAEANGFFDKSQGYEAVVQYQLTDAFKPSLAYVRTDVKDASQGIDSTLTEYVSVGGYYNFKPNVMAYVDYRWNQLSASEARQFGNTDEDIVAVGLRYDF